VEQACHPHEISVVEQQLPERYGLNLATTDLLLTTRRDEREIWCRPPHRFGTNLLDIRTDARQLHVPIDKSSGRKNTGRDDSDYQKSGPHACSIGHRALGKERHG
jgi:hypothetical protein